MFIKGLFIATIKENNHTLASFSPLLLGIIYEHLNHSTVTLGKTDLGQPYSISRTLLDILNELHELNHRIQIFPDVQSVIAMADGIKHLLPEDSSQL